MTAVLDRPGPGAESGPAVVPLRPGPLRLGPLRLGPLRLGPLTVDPPVVLAPMAGVTNAAFRTLCREQGAGLYVCEMITSRGVVERDPKTLAMLTFGADEVTRSVQLYGVDPATVAAAVRILVTEHGVAHVDLNFGCPVPKVTRRGGGAALPWKRALYADIVGSAVRAAEPAGVPVTVKTRLGIDADHLTYLDAGRIAQQRGAAAITLHGRTAAQAYSGQADWAPIAELAAELAIPVLGNGDIWEAADALRLLATTAAAGVVVGRGCLGRPWLFRDLAAALAGRPVPAQPGAGEVTATMRRHAELLAGLMGEPRGLADFRKHVAWYLKGFAVGSEARAALGRVSTITELDGLLARIDPAQPNPVEGRGTPRGRQGSPRRVALPEGWLAGRDDRPDRAGDGSGLDGAELDVSGG